MPTIGFVWQLDTTEMFWFVLACFGLFWFECGGINIDIHIDIDVGKYFE